MVDLQALSVARLAPLIESRQVSAETVTDACLEQIAARNGSINAFITILADAARAQAREADREIAAGCYRGPLHGVPISIKDLLDLRDTPTTAASRVRAGHVAREDAPVVARLREAGAIVVGKCNLHEFAFGTTSDESAFGPVRHPLDPTRSPGGSSGGSAAAIVSSMCLASVGTDTGGSIRIPAAACGVVGLKPTYDEFPCAGVVPLSPSLDHVGPLARGVADAWLLYHAMRGTPRPAPLTRRHEVPIETVRLGIPQRYFLDVLDDDVRRRFDEALARLQSMRVHIAQVDIPHACDIVPIYLHIVLSEAAACHGRTLETRAQDYCPGVRLRLEMGRYVLAEDYLRALKGRAVLQREVDRVLEECDALAIPTLPIPAPPLGATSVSVGGRPESVRNVMLRLTQLFNLTGHPAISIPCGQTPAGLPCGFQLVGKRHRTGDLLRTAFACEAHIGGTTGGPIE